MKTEKIIITAILCLTLLEVVALLSGINGILLTSVIAIIAGLAGWSAPQLMWRGYKFNKVRRR
ncbi:MAG TPA: hypothetical protein ENI22_01490 [Candidatus Pacearchaeota archaeon]|nr:hypothetical protein [Candidatus Pacearchaeota archaeon]